MAVGHGPAPPLTAGQCRAARKLLDWTTMRLAARANVSPATIIRLERGLGVLPATHRAVRVALEEAGLEFPEGGRPGVRLRTQGPAS
jgi:transcriptional regulator with XRE-family HTH domain